MPSPVMTAHILLDFAITLDQEVGGNAQGFDFLKIRVLLCWELVGKQGIDHSCTKLSGWQAYVVEDKQGDFIAWALVVVAGCDVFNSLHPAAFGIES